MNQGTDKKTALQERSRELLSALVNGQTDIERKEAVVENYRTDLSRAENELATSRRRLENTLKALKEAGEELARLQKDEEIAALRRQMADKNKMDKAADATMEKVEKAEKKK